METLSLAALFVLLAALLTATAGVFTAYAALAFGPGRQALQRRAEEGDPRARAAFALLADTRRILIGGLTWNLFAFLAAAGFLKAALRFVLPLWIPARELPPALFWLASSSFWTLLLMIPLHFLLAESLPRVLCGRMANTCPWLISRPALSLAQGWLPVAMAINAVLARLMSALRLPGGLEPVRMTRADLRALIETPRPEPRAATPRPDSPRRGMIRSILSLSGTLVREVMRPIGEVVAIRLGEMTPRQMIEFARRHKLTRFPVYRERMIDLIGYINIYDLLVENPEGKTLEEYLQEALFVPETARVDILLQEFLRRKTQCAIVFDEHGSCSGWVTREDLLKQIVGDLDAEGDPALQQLQEEAAGVYRVDPRMDLDDLNRLLDISLEKIHCDTVGGYIYSVLGRVPARGERIYLRRWILEVVEVEGHILGSIRLIRRPQILPRQEGD